MHDGAVTSHEAQLLHRILAQHGITHYEIVGAVEEGAILPGSTSPRDIESFSGYVVTPTNAYSFWFDWQDGSYTLGERNGTWRELTADDMKKNDEVLEA
jgi:hypothetical protein